LSIDPDGVGAKKAFAVTVLGNFSTANFQAVSDGAGGTFIEFVSGAPNAPAQLAAGHSNPALQTSDYHL
jgi:hypothetical protein